MHIQYTRHKTLDACALVRARDSTMPPMTHTCGGLTHIFAKYTYKHARVPLNKPTHTFVVDVLRANIRAASHIQAVQAVRKPYICAHNLCYARARVSFHMHDVLKLRHTHIHTHTHID